MEEEEKNKETDPNDSSTNKKNSIDNDMSHNNYNTNNSEVFRHMNKEITQKNEENLQGTQTQEMEIKTEPNNQSQINAAQATKNNPLMQSTFNFTHSRRYYFKINRCLTARIKKIILIIFLTISIFFVFISLFDIINSIRKTSFFKENKFLMNYLIVFIFQIAYALSLLLFQGLSIIMEPKKNILFNIISIILISTIIILRTVLVIKNDDKNITMLLNLLCSICLTFINFGIFMMTLKTLKMKKNVQQNIDEILNFTVLLQATNNSKITEKKDTQLMLNNSSSESKQEIQNQNNKEGISQLVEESNINNNNIINPNEVHK
jgi:hypothetical protein